MDYSYCITALEDYAAAPEEAGVDNDFFIDIIKFVKEQQDQIKMQVLMKENEITERIKLEKELKQEIKDISMSGIKHTEQLTEEINELKNFVRILKAEKNAAIPHIKKLLGENEERMMLEQFKKEVIDATQLDDDLDDYEYIDYIKKIESEYDPEHSSKDKDTDETMRAIKQISKLYQENKKLKKDIARVQKERNYLGDYCGGATSDEDN